MALLFAGIDPNTQGDNCPAVFIDEETGDLIFQGATVTDQAMLAFVDAHSRIADDESVVRLPARMRQIIMEAINGHGATVQRPDRSDGELSGSHGDARRLHTGLPAVP